MYKGIGVMVAGAAAFVAGQFGVVIDDQEQVALGGAVVAIIGAIVTLYQLYKANKGGGGSGG